MDEGFNPAVQPISIVFSVDLAIYIPLLFFKILKYFSDSLLVFCKGTFGTKLESLLLFRTMATKKGTISLADFNNDNLPLSSQPTIKKAEKPPPKTETTHLKRAQANTNGQCNDWTGYDLVSSDSHPNLHGESSWNQAMSDDLAGPASNPPESSLQKQMKTISSCHLAEIITHRMTFFFLGTFYQVGLSGSTSIFQAKPVTSLTFFF